MIDKTGILAHAIRITIMNQTKLLPMTAEDVIGVLCFMAGSAAGQKEAHSRHSPRQLREMAISYLDAGMQAADKQAQPKLIISN